MKWHQFACVADIKTNNLTRLLCMFSFGFSIQQLRSDDTKPERTTIFHLKTDCLKILLSACDMQRQFISTEAIVKQLSVQSWMIHWEGFHLTNEHYERTLPNRNFGSEKGITCEEIEYDFDGAPEKDLLLVVRTKK